MIFYLYGENSYAISQQARLIKEKYFEKTGQDGDYARINLAEQGLDDLLANLTVLPMFASSRLLIADGISTVKITESQLKELVETIPESTNLVLSDVKPDRRTLVFKTLSKQKGAKEFKNLPLAQLTVWVKNQVKKAGGSIEDKDILHLIDRAGQDQWNLAGEVAKLVSFDPEVSTKNIDKLTSATIEHSAFELAEALARGELARTLKLYSQLQTQGQPDQMILGAIIYQYRVLLALLAGTEAARAMKISPYALQKSRSLAQGLNIAGIKKIYAQLAETDLTIKTGQLGSEQAIKQLFYMLCNNK